MTKSDRIDPLVHYSRQVRLLVAEKERTARAMEYLAGLAAPYVAPNVGPYELIAQAYAYVDGHLNTGETQ